MRERFHGAFKTFWSIVTHPLGHGAPIPLRYDEHVYEAAGVEEPEQPTPSRLYQNETLDEAIVWLKAHPVRHHQPRRVA